MQTSTDYRTAYLKEKARSEALQKMLNEQIEHTASAIREMESLRDELKEACDLYEANHR